MFKILKTKQNNPPLSLLCILVNFWGQKLRSFKAKWKEIFSIENCSFSAFPHLHPLYYALILPVFISSICVRRINSKTEGNCYDAEAQFHEVCLYFVFQIKPCLIMDSIFLTCELVVFVFIFLFVFDLAFFFFFFLNTGPSFSFGQFIY